MPVAMTDRQLAFFRELLQPFPASAYYTVRRGNKDLTYIKARVIQNRLDDVVGPQGWVAEYESTPRGYKCRLKILCPDETQNGMRWHYKEDGGGPEDMGAYAKNGEWETDVDNDEKSAYTNAFRRAAAAWGFGRELYGEGMPYWLCDMYGQTPVTTVDGEIPTVSAGRPSKPHVPAQAAELPGAPQGPLPSRQRMDHKFRPPTKPGKACYAWIKSLESHFNADRKILNAAIAFMKKEWGTDRTDQLNAEQLQVLTDRLVAWIKTWEQYGGEFDDGSEDSASARAADQRDPMKSLKRSIVAAAQTLVKTQTGRDATTEETMAAVGEIAAMVKNGKGCTGEVLESLRDCADKTWLLNIQAEATRQLERAAKEYGDQGAAVDSVPF